MIKGEVPPKAKWRTHEDRTPHRAALASRLGLSERELRAQGLPLYLSDTWLRRALEECGSQAGIEATYGYSNQILSRRLIELGIRTRPRVTKKDRERVRALLAEGRSYSVIAELTGISKPTISRIAKERAPQGE